MGGGSVAGLGLSLRDVCDIAYAIWFEQAERVAIADRQALLTAAAINGRLEDYQPLNVAAEMDAFDEWLAMDPADSPQAREAALDRAYLEEVA